jgi:apolipoprotein N-acyltransferase
MKTSPFLINLFIYGPYVILLILFIIFFYRAITFHGITKLKKFTVVMLGAFVVAFALRYFKFGLFDWVPIQFLKVAGNGNTTNSLILIMMVFFVISITKIRTEKNTKFLTINWLIIGLFSAAFTCWLAYFYIRWNSPDNEFPATRLQLVIDQHKLRSFYLKEMIYPFSWVVASCISLWKIRKEKRRLM